MGKWVWSPLTIWAFLSGNCGVFSGSLQWALHCSQLWNCQGSSEPCVCVCVYACVCVFLLVQPHKVSRVTTALGARSKMRLGMQSDPKHTCCTQHPLTHSHTHTRLHTWHKRASEKNGLISNDDTRTGISVQGCVLWATCRLQINLFWSTMNLTK